MDFCAVDKALRAKLKLESSQLISLWMISRYRVGVA